MSRQGRCAVCALSGISTGPGLPAHTEVSEGSRLKWAGRSMLIIQKAEPGKAGHGSQARENRSRSDLGGETPTPGLPTGGPRTDL